MLSAFPEFIENCVQQIKGDMIEDEWGNVTFPTIDKNIKCIARHSVSIQKEVALGYSVDLVLYTYDELLKTNDVIYDNQKYIVKRIDKKRGHFENYLVMKNV